IQNNPTTNPIPTNVQKSIYSSSQPSVQNTSTAPQQSLYNNLNHQNSQPKDIVFVNKNGVSSNGYAPQTIPVIPGKLYTLDDDPLLEFYDKQTTTNSRNFQNRYHHQQQQQPSTVQKQTIQSSQGSDPYKHLFQGYTNTTYPTQQQQQPIFVSPSNFQPYAQFSNPVNDRLFPTFYSNESKSTTINGTLEQKFDLGNLIHRVQQDYMREIEPFVSSVKFIEKTPELQPELSKFEFSTPVSVRKGYMGQADDLLRRSFGRRNKDRSSSDRRMRHHRHDNKYDKYDNKYDNIDERSYRSKRRHKQSLTSVTSTSTTASSNKHPKSSRRKSSDRLTPIQDVQHLNQTQSSQPTQMATHPPNVISESSYSDDESDEAQKPLSHTSSNSSRSSENSNTSVINRANVSRNSAINSSSPVPQNLVNIVAKTLPLASGASQSNTTQSITTRSSPQTTTITPAQMAQKQNDVVSGSSSGSDYDEDASTEEELHSQPIASSTQQSVTPQATPSTNSRLPNPATTSSQAAIPSGTAPPVT
ncbi:unnamed protein product, partial [Didymodactylos carnosus]